MPAQPECLDRLGRQVVNGVGRVVALDLPGPSPGYQELLDHLAVILDLDTEVRLVLGRACATAARTIEQFVAALQLPYGSAASWEEFLREMGGGRPVWPPECVLVAEAADLLKDEDALWHGLVRSSCHPPSCLGQPKTLVLADRRDRWERSAFGSAMAAEEAGNQPLRRPPERR